MKKLSVYFFILIIVFCPLVAAAENRVRTDDNTAASGYTAEANGVRSAKIADKYCEGIDIGKSCRYAGVTAATCQNIVVDNQGTIKKTCVAKECDYDKGYVLHGKGYWGCKTKKAAENFCKTPSLSKVECKSDEIAIVYLQPTSKITGARNAKGYGFDDCYCVTLHSMKYNCGEGTGTPPTDTAKYTSLDEVVIKQNESCKKVGAKFKGWTCGNPGDNIQITEDQTCTAVYSGDEYTVNYDCGVGAAGTVPANEKVPYNTAVNLPGYDAGCTKDGSIFSGWLCDDQNVKETFTVTKNTKCIAQWDDCDQCTPGQGCTCELKVENNKCKYYTGVEQGFLPDGGENTATPQCKKENVCPDDQEGTPPNCTCKDTNKTIINGKCECPDGKQEDDNGNCIEKIEPVVEIEEHNCPETDQHWDETEQGCVCNDTTQQKDVNGKCITPVKEEPVKTPCPADITTGEEHPNCKCNDTDRDYNKETKTCDCKTGFKEDENENCVNKLDELKQTFEDAKANEQSLANRTLTAASIAATGIGGMELAMGLSEQKADKEAQQDMSAYIASFRCEYGNGKQVKAGPEEIVLPGGNDEKLMSLRTKYMTLATDLKERKTALGMKPGIESEEILDKTAMNLYDDENTGIESGAYGSLYRAKMLGSEEDQAKLDEEAKKSKNRVIAGATVAGAGIVGGIAGNMAINGTDGKKNLNKIQEARTTENGMSPIPAKRDKCARACELTNETKKTKHLKRFNCPACE